MPVEPTTENHLSRDELLEILNEIDTERQYDRTKTDDHRKEGSNKGYSSSTHS